MTITRLADISVWDRPPHVTGAVCFGYADRWLTAEWTSALDLSDRCTITVDMAAKLRTLAAERRVVCLHGEPATPGAAGPRRIFRVHQVREERTAGQVGVTIQARSLIYDWVDAGPVSIRLAAGSHQFAIAQTLTPQDWVQQILLPHLARQTYDYFIWGGATSFFAVAQTVSGEHALQILQNVAGEIGLEIELDEATAVVSLNAAINGALDPLRLTHGFNLARLARTRAFVEMATMLVPVAGKGHSETSRSIQRHAFQAVNVNVGALSLEAFPIDTAGWTYPMVVADGAFDPAADRTYYLMRTRTGRCFRILSSLAPAGATLSKFFVEDLNNPFPSPEGHEYELREGLDPAARLDVPVPGRPLRVTSAGPTQTVLTLEDPFTGGDPCPTDDVHLDAHVRVSVFAMSTTCANIANAGAIESDLTVPSTIGMIVGQWGFLHDNVATPWSLFQRVFVVTAIPSATVVRVRSRYTWQSGRPFTAGAVAKQLRLYTTQPDPLGYVHDEVAAANQITLSRGINCNANDLIEYDLDNSGALLTALPSPQRNISGVVRKSKTFDEYRCTRNLLWGNNPVFDQWTSAPPAAPNGWTITNPGFGPPIVRLSGADLFGPGTVYAMRLQPTMVIRSPLFYPRGSVSDSKCAVRVVARPGPGWTGASDAATIRVFTGGTSPQLVAQVVVGVLNAQPDTKAVADLLNIDVLASYLLSPTSAAYIPWTGLFAEITVGSSAEFDVGGVMVVPEGTFPDTSFFTPSGEQNVFGLGTQALGEVQRPEESCEVEAFDLSAMLRAQFPNDALLTGRTIRVEDELAGIFFEDRIAAVTSRASPAGEVSVTVATRRRDFSDLLAKQLAARPLG